MSRKGGIVTLRPVVEGDAERICLLAGDYQVSRMTSVIPHPYTMQAARDFIKSTSGEAYDVSAICLDGEFVGVVSADIQDAARPEARTIGYWLGRPYWGNGIMRRALELKISYAFATGVRKLRASVMQDNPASLRVLERCGFTQTSAVECPSLSRGTSVPAIAFELSQD